MTTLFTGRLKENLLITYTFTMIYINNIPKIIDGIYRGKERKFSHLWRKASEEMIGWRHFLFEFRNDLENGNDRQKLFMWFSIESKNI